MRCVWNTSSQLHLSSCVRTLGSYSTGATPTGSCRRVWRMTAPETMEHVDKWSAHQRHLEPTFDFVCVLKVLWGFRREPEEEEEERATTKLKTG